MDIKRNHPLCHFAMLKRAEGEKNLIYHYTSADGFFNILRSMSLKMSVFSKSDDLNEANVANVDRIDNVQTMLALEKFIKDKCSYLSFVQDGKIELDELEGTNHPRMWSHYAQKGYGVCLAIDENKFFNINAKSLDSKFYKFEKVEYEHKNGACITINAQNGEKEEDMIKGNYHELFFKKHIDWKEENEKRLFGIDLPEFLSIYGALEFICLGPKFIKDESMMVKLLDFLTDSTTPFYGYLIPQSFAGITPYDYGYFSHDSLAISEIDCRLNRWNKYKQYLDDWCQNNM